jgi:ribosomal-protein-serine acetyltransferase
MFTLKVDQEIELRLLESHDAEPLFALVDTNREHLRPWLFWVDTNISPNDTLEFIEIMWDSFTRGRGFSSGIWFNNEIAGVIGLYPITRQHRSASIGYWIARDFEGKGIVTRSCRSLINYAFRELELNRIEIRCAVENERSRRIPERLGFRNEGTARESERVNDVYYDSVIYGLLAREWSP